MSNLQLLHTQYQQSPWLDNLSRDIIENGKLQQYVTNGIRGITSNPTIFENAIANTNLYDNQIKQLKAEGKNSEEVYWEIAKQDIKNSAAILKSIYTETGGSDGFVSLEVSPEFAHDTEATIAQARQLWSDLHDKQSVENLMIKVPATKAGIPAIRALLSEGVNVNITLLFSVERYKEVIKAYKTAIQLQPNVKSVASFFVSRIDTMVDPLLQDQHDSEADNITGRVALAQAHIAYDIFSKAFDSNTSGDVQKILWASTSTKNPDYDKLIYVKSLLATNTINTLPDATIEAIEQVDNFEFRAIDQLSIESSRQVMRVLANQAMSIEEICTELEVQGVQKFKDSFKSLLATIESK